MEAMTKMALYEVRRGRGVDGERSGCNGSDDEDERWCMKSCVAVVRASAKVAVIDVAVERSGRGRR